MHPENTPQYFDCGTVTNGRLTLNLPNSSAFTSWVNAYLSNDLSGVTLPSGVKAFWANLGIQGQTGGLVYGMDISAGEILEVAYVYFSGLTESTKISGTYTGTDTTASGVTITYNVSFNMIVYPGWNPVCYVQKDNGTVTDTVLSTHLGNLPPDLKWRLFK